MKKQTAPAAVVTLSASTLSAAVADKVASLAAPLSAAFAAADSATVKADNAQGKFAGLLQGLLTGQPAPVVAATIGRALADLAALADTNTGKKATEKERATEWRRLANSFATVARRVNLKTEKAPIFGLFFIGLDSEKRAAQVEIEKAPTVESIKAKGLPTKAENAAVEAIQAGRMPCEPAPGKAGANGGKAGANGGEPTPSASGNAYPVTVAGILAATSQWAPADLESLANALLQVASEKRAPAKKPARAKSAAPKRGPMAKPAAPAQVATAPTGSPVSMPKPTAGAKLAKKGASDPLPVGIPTVADKSAAA